MTESEKSPVDPPRLGLFARMYSRAALKPLEFSIPLEQVLEEEFDQLHARETPEDQRGVATDPTLRWRFLENQVLDAARIIERLRESTKDAPRGSTAQVAAVNALRAVVRLIELQAPGRLATAPAADAAARQWVAAELNTLLLSELASDTCFNDFPLTDVLRVALEQYAGTKDKSLQARLNRVLLEAIFPTELKRVSDVRLERVFERIRPARHAALCLSGGGIRSGTFALGFVQAMAECGLLRRFDYISTVSGGGYLGGWLSAWMRHADPDTVVAQLRCAPQSKVDPEAAPIRHLRAYSNFLSPRVGLFTADMWALVATYIRNLLVNWIVLVPLLAAVVIVPHLAVAVIRTSPAHWNVASSPRLLPTILLVIGIIAGSLAVRFVHKNRPERESSKADGKAPLSARDQNAFLVWCLAPLLLSAVTLTTAWTWFDRWRLIQPGGRALATFMGVGVLIHVIGYFSTGRSGRNFGEFIAITVTGAVAGAIAYASAMVLRRVEIDADQLYVVVAAPIFLTTIILAGNLFLGLTSRVTKDPEREWSARYSAWVFISVVVWTVVSAIVLFGADFVRTQTEAAIGTFSITGLAGLIVAKLGFSPKTKAKSSSNTPAPNAGMMTKLAALTGGNMLAIVAAIALAGVFVLLSVMDVQLIALTCRWLTATCVQGEPVQALPAAVALTGIALAVVGLGAGRLIDTNKFSLHAMYRARLIRAYLGASRPAGERSPDPFTGFDEQDNLFMHELRPTREKPNERPIHLVNIALNLVGGDNLAWQERKAAPFTVSSLHAGSHRLGYRRTSRGPGGADQDRWQRDQDRKKHLPVDGYYGGDNGISLGTAMTISGAAASPNMGYHSSPTVTFLMTLLNVRLGWWLGNPGPAGDTTFDRASPRLGIKPIISEMFGRTNGANSYVYLSDGGHFENLGLYEAVLRRCRFVVVCDASCDEKCELSDLGNAIRKIRIDLGIPIEFEQPFGIRSRSAMARTDVHDEYYAVATIRYSAVDAPSGASVSPADYDGTLIYVKPAFYGREPRDVFNYATESSAFPHESTADQFFSETQFESYRALGHWVAKSILREKPVADRVAELDRGGVA